MRKQRAQNTPTAHADQSVELWTIPMVLEPGHPMRGGRCAVCAMLIGARAVRVFTVTGLEESECCGNHLISIGVLICAEHEPDGNGTVARQVVKMQMRKHGGKH